MEHFWLDQSLPTDKLQRLRTLLLLLDTTNLVFSLGGKLFELLPHLAAVLATDAGRKKMGLSAEEIAKLKYPDWSIVDQDLLWSEQEGHHIITIDDDAYPPLLKEIANPPAVLFAIGDLQLLKSPQLAMVGSRNPTPVGIETAFNFAVELVNAGFVITSGLATGIDAASHKGAIAGFGKTIAVMGTGLKYIYPASNSKLAQEIVESGGVLLSEFPLAARGKSWHFPLRNRIIGGLSIGTLVVEANIRSGSLITARLAGEYGREVFAIPGSIYNVMARGCHYLIHQGAKLVGQPSDIFDEFSTIIKKMCSQSPTLKDRKTKNTLDCEHNKLLDCTGFETTTVDVLVSRTGFSVAKVGEMLLDLELHDLIKSVVGGYVKIR